MTTQSPHLYARQPRSAGGTARTASLPVPRMPDAGGAPAAGPVQTRLPWWGVVLPALAFAALLVLLSAGSADASAAAPAGDWFVRLVAALPDLVRHLG